MAYAVALGVLREPGLAAGRGAGGLPARVPAARRSRGAGRRSSWLRRIVITVALNCGAARRRTLLRLDDVPDVPVLDEAETSWSEPQRHQLARRAADADASDERRLCDRRYHGGWSIGRLARDAGVDEPAMRKRLQRVRDKLRKEIEMSEQRDLVRTRCRPRLPGGDRRAAGAAAADRSPGEPGRRRARPILRTRLRGLRADRSSPRSSTSPRARRRSATTRSTWRRASCTASTIAASCATT